MPKKATSADAELILKLYELRREPEMRKARNWWMNEFWPQSADDFIKLAMSFPSQENQWMRQAATYWEMEDQVGSRTHQGTAGSAGRLPQASCRRRQGGLMHPRRYVCLAGNRPWNANFINRERKHPQEPKTHPRKNPRASSRDCGASGIK